MKTPKKYLQKKVEHEFGVQDPYYRFEEVVAPDGTVTMKKTKREIPEGLSDNDVKVLKKIKLRAYRLELFFSIFGCNVGWGAVVAFIPVVGGFLFAYMSYKTVEIASGIDGGLTNWERSRMMYNVAVNSVAAVIPLVGDVISAVYKGNTRNAALLEEVLAKRGQKNLAAGTNTAKLSKRGVSVGDPDKKFAI